MTFGQWFGQFFGDWLGPAEQAPGAMTGSASIHFSAVGNLTNGAPTTVFIQIGGGGFRIPIRRIATPPIDRNREVECLLLAALALLESETL